MKKAITAAAALALVLGTMTACANKNTTQQTPTTEGALQQMEDGVGDVAQGVGDAVGDVGRAAGDLVQGAANGMQHMLDALGEGARDFVEVDEQEYLNTYGIDRSKYEEVVIRSIPTESGVGEIILIRAKDEGENLQQAVADLEARKTALQQQWSDGVADQHELVNSAVVRTRGPYAALIAAQNAAEAQKAFDSMDITMVK